MKTPNEEILKLLEQLDSDSKRLAYQAERKLLEIVEKEGWISKDICPHPDFADCDCDEYNYCKLCGKCWSV